MVEENFRLKQDLKDAYIEGNKLLTKVVSLTERLCHLEGCEEKLSDV